MALVYETLGKTRVREGENPERDGVDAPDGLSVAEWVANTR
jgi:hypothetical protein